jgi:signal peptidase II
MPVNRLAFGGWLLLAASVVSLDRFTKYLASTHLPFGEAVPVLPVLNLRLLHNTGAAFSFLSDAGGWQRWAFSLLAMIVSLGIVFWLRSLAGRQRLLPCALAFIMGGALGNLWDRVAAGYVIDFIEVYYDRFGWPPFPAFNVADSAITVGAALLMVDALLGRRRAA